MNATADVPSSRLKKYRGGGDRKDRSLFAARLAAILLVVSIAAAAAAFLALPLRSLVSSSSSASASASSSHVLWLFVVVIAAAIWILHDAAAPPHHDGVQFASGWTAQLWNDDGIHPPTMSEYYYYDNDVNATSESAFEAVAKNTRVVEPPMEEEEEGEDDESMDATWEAIVRRCGARKSEERVENSTKDDAIHLRRKVVYKEGGVREKKKAAEGWRKREVAVANDELFRRVETFIKKHYDHLRLQRQESDRAASPPRSVPPPRPQLMAPAVLPRPLRGGTLIKLL